MLLLLNILNSLVLLLLLRRLDLSSNVELRRKSTLKLILSLTDSYSKSGLLILSKFSMLNVL